MNYKLRWKTAVIYAINKTFFKDQDPLSSSRQHYKIDICLEDNREDY